MKLKIFCNKLFACGWDICDTKLVFVQLQHYGDV